MGLTVATVAIDQVIPYARNPRKNAAAVAKVAASLREFGWRQPIVVDEAMTVIAGHTRLLAARQLGMAEVPVHIATGLTPAQVKAYRLADNRVAQEAEWDDALLGLELADLKGLDFDLALTGFEPDEVADLLGDGGLLPGVDPDDAPEVPAEPITQPGDLIILGRHRLLCGDATDAAAVARLLDGSRPHLMVTDPPYGVEYEPTWRERYDHVERHARGKVANDDRSDWREAWALFPGDVAYCWHAGQHASTVQASFEVAGFQVRCQIIWAKQHFVFGRGDYHWQHEPCWYLVRRGTTGRWAGDRKQTTLWEIPNLNPMGGGGSEGAPSGHGTQKPVACMLRPIQNNSVPGDAIYDPFVGSGTTVVACEMSGRLCYAVELSPAYCDVIVARWEQATGQTAVRPAAVAA